MNASNATMIRPGSLAPLGLTRRETQVLSQVAQGRTNIEIGTALSISSRTVQTHLEHIFERIGVETRTAAVAKAFEVDRVVSGVHVDEEGSKTFLRTRLNASRL